MKRIASLVLAFVLAALAFSGCGQETALLDGYYTAQAAEFNFGWKEYITIMVRGGSIVSVEYNAECQWLYQELGQCVYADNAPF